jgi:uncharacterized NAD(P)/FAD-binding protein YdhS
MLSTRGHDPVLIVGGGASGTLTAIHLLQAVAAPSIVILEPRESLGEGIAYSTTSSAHLLNVRAAGMSAFPDRPDHFVQWLARSRGLSEDAARPIFAQRREYAAYLKETLAEACRASSAKVQHVRDRAHDIRREGSDFVVETTDSGFIECRHVVLALGNRRPKLPPVIRSSADPRIVIDPWSQAAKAVQPDEHVLLIGSGLTMIDTVLQLREGGHQGKLTAISRNGRLPAVHTDAKPQPPFDPSSTSLRQVARTLITAARARANESKDWRSVIDSVRPFVQKTWRELPTSEKRRFTRRLQTLWDVHRHRVAPLVHGQLVDLQSAGGFEVIRGRIGSITSTPDRLRVEYRTPSGPLTSLAVDRVINCTGPNPSWTETPDRLAQSLVDRGLAEYDELGHGLKIGDGFTVSEGIYALGPVCRGTLWETTAIPEIRGQAAQIAKQVAHQVATGHPSLALT